MNLGFIKPQNLGSLLMKSSQSNFDLWSPSSYELRSYLITTVQFNIVSSFIGLVLNAVELRMAAQMIECYQFCCRFAWP